MPRTTPTRAFEAFLTERQAQGLTPAGETWYRDAWARFTAFAGRRAFPSQQTAQLYLRFLRQEHVEDETWWPAWRGVEHVLRWFHARGYTRHDLGRFELRKPVGTGRPAMTEADLLPLIGAARRHDAERLITLLWFAGWRSSALVALTWQDVDIDAGLLYGPTFEGQRAEMQLQGKLAEKMLAWQRASTSEFLLSDVHGAPLTVADVHRVVRAVGKTARRPFLAPGQFQLAYVRQYLRYSTHPFGPDSVYLSRRLGHMIRVRNVPISNVVDFEELRAEHERHSPARQLLRNDPPSRPPLKTLKSRRNS
ncbi:hypothetical protein [Deinococcus yavapaiensis]|uniref:Site-specific recombinase XerD n=1 Tax=Deinococcus yavapaiensis KR-236 TaxID=694435 RepID=A0A318SAM7_9DEIO|nr:hypothetical protein [Deinococcus yavapaiensis]PYE53301.1 hypothetical protein DES52_10973 [Deinococcus yavapaiensis KR-236]